MLLEAKPKEKTNTSSPDVTTATMNFFTAAQKHGLNPKFVHVDKCWSEIIAAKVTTVVLVQELEVVVGGYILFRCCLPMTIRFYFLGHSQLFIFSLANPPHNLNFTTKATRDLVIHDRYRLSTQLVQVESRRAH